MGKICNGDCLNCIFDDCISGESKSTAEYQRKYRQAHKEKFKKYEHTRYIKNHADEMCRRRLQPIIDLDIKKAEVLDG